MAVVAMMSECVCRRVMATITTYGFVSDITCNHPCHLPLSGLKTGPDAVIAFFGALMQTGIVVDNVTFGTMGDDQVVEKHTGHGKLTNGEEIIFPTCSHYTIKDGRIAKVQVYTGDQHGVDRYFWAMYDLKPIPDRLDSHDPANMHDRNDPPTPDQR